MWLSLCEQTNKQTERHTHVCVNRQTNKLKDILVFVWTDKQTNWKTYPCVCEQTNRQTERHTHVTGTDSSSTTSSPSILCCLGLCWRSRGNSTSTSWRCNWRPCFSTYRTLWQCQGFVWCVQCCHHVYINNYDSKSIKIARIIFTVNIKLYEKVTTRT